MTEQRIDDPAEYVRAFKSGYLDMYDIGALHRALDDLAVEKVADARRKGATWAHVGEALGISRQRAARLYGDE